MAEDVPDAGPGPPAAAQLWAHEPRARFLLGPDGRLLLLFTFRLIFDCYRVHVLARK